MVAVAEVDREVLVHNEPATAALNAYERFDRGEDGRLKTVRSAS